MKTISLWQPYASLIACGAKPYETRHWAPPKDLIGTTIAIHAAKKFDKDGATLAMEVMIGRHAINFASKLAATMRGTPDHLMGRYGKVTMPAGCVVCTARLDAAFQLGEPAEGTVVPAARVIQRMTSRPMPECFSVRYDEFGDYAPGRWAWLLRDVKPIIPPVAAIGRQGFFEWAAP